MSRQTGVAPIANTKPQTLMEYKDARNASLRDPLFRVHLVQYINEVSVRAQAHRLRMKLS